MYIIKNEHIKKALEDTTRQFLLGKLSRPQTLEYIEVDKARK